MWPEFFALFSAFYNLMLVGDGGMNSTKCVQKVDEDLLVYDYSL